MSVSVTNSRLFQLVLMVMLTSVVIYPYTVVAFNFFRKLCTKEEDGEKECNCNDMLTIEPLDGDAYEAPRILFDMSPYFSDVIIFLAIMQGLCLLPLLLTGADHLVGWEKVSDH
ncbi:Ryanodine receptor 3 [Taenia solium]|eukprot:TsM_000341900 transcript=TsM_000341900 gene=TsM_000341900